MLSFQAIWRAVIWLLIGIVFGLSSLLLIFASSAIFTHPISTSNLFDANIIMFLCVSLMSGAGGDFLLSKISNPGTRIAVFFPSVVALLIVCFLFSPNNSSAPEKYVVKGFALGYGIATFIYCVSLKTIIFYRERLTDRKLNFK